MRAPRPSARWAPTSRPARRARPRAAARAARPGARGVRSPGADLLALPGRLGALAPQRGRGRSTPRRHARGGEARARGAGAHGGAASTPPFTTRWSRPATTAPSTSSTSRRRTAAVATASAGGGVASTADGSSSPPACASTSADRQGLRSGPLRAAAGAARAVPRERRAATSRSAAPAPTGRGRWAWSCRTAAHARPRLGRARDLGTRPPPLAPRRGRAPPPDRPGHLPAGGRRPADRHRGGPERDRGRGGRKGAVPGRPARRAGGRAAGHAGPDRRRDGDARLVGGPGVKSDPTFWLLARATGITAYVLLTVSVLAGLAGQGAAVRHGDQAAAAVDLHRRWRCCRSPRSPCTASRSCSTTPSRSASLALLVPGTAPYRPLWTGARRGGGRADADRLRLLRPAPADRPAQLAPAALDHLRRFAPRPPTA